MYGVTGVPHVMIVDKTGKIVFKGHPSKRKNLEQDLDDLSEGKSLEGVEAQDDSKPETDKGKEIDSHVLA